MTKYIEAFSWTSTIERFLSEIIEEKPLLHVCSGKSELGDVTVDKYTEADYQCDMRKLPFADDSFGAVFCDPPWNVGMKKEVAEAMPELLRVAPVVYLMSCWTWGSSKATLEKAWVRWFPGINNAILICKYHRNHKLEGYHE
jgi:hypothetical protein